MKNELGILLKITVVGCRTKISSNHRHTDGYISFRRLFNYHWEKLAKNAGSFVC